MTLSAEGLTRKKRRKHLPERKARTEPISIPPGARQRTKMAYRSCFRDGIFQGKVALVTGGGTGIGFCIARELALLGATVVIAGRDVSKCEQGARRMQAELSSTSSTGSSSTVGTIVVGPSTDIRNPEQVEALVAFCVQQQGSLDILVNNAVRLAVSPNIKSLSPPRVKVSCDFLI